MNKILLHETRLFPKMRGADAYVPTGIAARCDWIVMSDPRPPQIHVIQRKADPDRIFLSMRAPFVALRHFAEVVLPELNRPFVLISGSEDVTLPDQTDQRWRPFNTSEMAMLARIHDHPLLRCWFVENLSRTDWPKMTPLPLGLVFPEGMRDTYAASSVPVAPRPLRVLCGHRVREGAQWEPRRRVTALAKGPWQTWTSLLDGPLTEPDFIAQMEEHSFVLCVEGGGLDPSPKAWQALLCGAIPIVRSTPLDGAYDLLPVARVADWVPGALSPMILARWKAKLTPQIEARGELLRRLSLDFWWERICGDGLYSALMSVPDTAREFGTERF